MLAVWVSFLQDSFEQQRLRRSEYCIPVFVATVLFDCSVYDCWGLEGEGVQGENQVCIAMLSSSRLMQSELASFGITVT